MRSGTELGPHAARPRAGAAFLERRCPAHARVDRALEGAQASWLSLRRPDDGLRAHAGVRPGERSPRRLPRARRRRTRPRGRALTPVRLRAPRCAAQLLAGEPAECFCSADKAAVSTLAARLPPSRIEASVSVTTPETPPTDDQQPSEPAGIRRLLGRESGRIGFRRRR